MHPARTTWNLGASVEKIPLEVVAIAPREYRGELPHLPARCEFPWILFMGGHHGNEIEGVWFVDELERAWRDAAPSERIGALLFKRVNPDGIEKKIRHNANGVDLNRNLPTKDWTPQALNPRYPPGPAAASEPETKALVKLIHDTVPRAILSAHSFTKPQVNINGPAPVEDWGARISKITGTPVTRDIGYPTPGSFGTYCAELGVPEITLELLSGETEEATRRLAPAIGAETFRFWGELA